MKTVRIIISFILAILVGVLFAVTNDLGILNGVVVVLISAVCLLGVEEKISNNVVWGLAAAAVYVILRFFLLEICIELLGIFLWFLEKALKIIGFGFSVGLTSGIIIAILVILILKWLFSK